MECASAFACHSVEDWDCPTLQIDQPKYPTVSRTNLAKRRSFRIRSSTGFQLKNTVAAQSPISTQHSVGSLVTTADEYWLNTGSYR